jgi:hypothetical protein
MKTILVTFTLLVSASAHGRECDPPIKVPIKFEPGALCWAYRGPGTLFYGDFAAGQQITANAIGIGVTEKEMESKSVAIGLHGPNGFYVEPYVENDSGSWRTNLEVSGQYECFVRSGAPCSLRLPVIIQVCTSRR